MNDRREAAGPEEFSLFLGGPLYQLLLRTGLARPPLDLLKRRVAVITLLAWVPPLVMSVLEGHAFGGVRIPFLKDLDVQVRLLFALPLLVLAEKVVHDRISPAVRLFVEKGIIRPEDRERFDGIVASTLRLRNSAVVELVILVLVFTAGYSLWRQEFAVHGDTWFSAGGDGSRLSNAGLVFAWWSRAIFQFIFLRWLYRLVLWGRFLFLASRLDLDLSPAHPDRAGGLGFLGTSTQAFAPLILAQSALVSALAATRILEDGVPLSSLKVELGGALGLALLETLGPLLVFGPVLAKLKRRGLNAYGLLGDRYVREFDRKWIRGGAAPDEALVGTADIQSLADLEGSFDIVRGMQAFPFGKENVVQLAVMAILPGLPLLLTVMPLDQLVKKLVGAIL